MLIFLSDLHIGAGDVLDDFILYDSGSVSLYKKAKLEIKPYIEKMDNAFDLFINHLMENRTKDEEIEIIMLGDIFDCLQVRDAGYASYEKIKRIYKAHKKVFESLNKFMEKGFFINYVLGNHDHEAGSESCFTGIKSFLPDINKKSDGRILHYYENPEYNLYAEHGNQSDYLNRYKNPYNFEEKTFGSIFVSKIINNFEEKYPLIDNCKDLHEALWLLLKKVPGFLSSNFKKKIKDLFSPASLKDISDISDMQNKINYKEIFKGVLDGKPYKDSHPVNIIRFILNIFSDKTGIRENDKMYNILLRLIYIIEMILREKNYSNPYGAALMIFLSDSDGNPIKILRDYMSERHIKKVKAILCGIDNKSNNNNLIHTPAFKVDNLVLGHYHTPLLQQCGDKTYMNTGTWKPYITTRGARNISISQALNYGIVQKGKDNQTEMKLYNFKQTKAFKNMFNK